MNTPACWSCPAPISIEFVSEADVSTLPHERGLVYEGYTLRITTGTIRQRYQATHLSVCLPEREPFPIAHRDIVRVADVYGGTIWEKSVRQKRIR